MSTIPAGHKRIVNHFEKAVTSTISLMKKEKYSIINEDDFKCYLFSAMLADPLLGREYKATTGERLKIIHTEYYHPNANSSGAGSFDLAILDPDRLHVDINRGIRSIHNRKPVLVGCEMKWRRNSNIWYIKYFLKADSLKFIPNKKFAEHASRFGYVMYIHFADTASHQHTKKELQHLKEFMESLKERLSREGQVLHLLYLQINKKESSFTYDLIRV